MDRFHTAELERALAEQCFGIAASHIDEDRSASSGSSAFAVITLLEQREIQVKLSNNGYEVIGEGNITSDNTQARVFETLDDLLLAISPKYGERRTEELMTRLSQFADTSSQP